jgi:hypothetical protein
MQFLKSSIPGIVAGTTTVTFRGWKKPLAVPGGRHRVWGQLIEVDEVRVVNASDITDAEARRAGEPNAERILHFLGDKAKDPVYRIEFHYVGPDDRELLRNSVEALTPERRAEIQARLDRMDRASKDGPWTAKSLRLIGTYPGLVSTVLARQLQQDRPAFKTNIRKLKELGLTESLEIGYRLSPLGMAFTGFDESEQATPEAAQQLAAQAGVAPSPRATRGRRNAM